MSAARPISPTPDQDGPRGLNGATDETEAGPTRNWGAPGWAVVGIFVIMLIGVLAYAEAFVLPTVGAFLLAVIFSPVVRFLARRGLPAWLSAIGIVAGVGLALLVAIYVVSGPLTTWIDDAPEIARELQRELRSLRGSVDQVVEATRQVDQLTEGGDDAQVQEVVVRSPGLMSSLATTTPSVLARLVFATTLLLFLLASGSMFYEKLVYVMPTLADKKRALRIVYDVERQLSRYLFTITMINAGLGVTIGVAMWLLGMPSPFLFGVIGFAFNFVPYLGAIAGAGLAGVIGLVEFDDLTWALSAAGAYLLCTSIEGQFVTPNIVGRRLEMNTVAVFLSLAFWAWIWGIPGMLVAVPLLLTIRVFCDHIPSLQYIGEFLAARREAPEVEDQSETDKAAH